MRPPKAAQARLLWLGAIACTLATSVGCSRTRQHSVHEPGYPQPGYPQWSYPTPVSNEAALPEAVHASAQPTPAASPILHETPPELPPPPPTGAMAAAGAAAAPKEAASYRQPVPEGDMKDSDPAVRIANLSPAACRKELEARALPVAPVRKNVAGVATPLRLTGPLGGVRFVAPGGSSAHGIVDCRLVLALEELAAVLTTFGVVEVRLDNTYRKGARIRTTGKRSQHGHALAADITQLKLESGEVLTAEDHWGATIGDRPCGPRAEMRAATTQKVTLRNIVCAVARRGVFHVMLTPSYNHAHRDHFHFDIKRDGRWRTLQ